MSKYYKWNKRGSKIIIDTGYKSFDNYIVCIAKGNVLGGGQTSYYIRPRKETKCNNENYPMGELREHDLSVFNLTAQVKKYVESITEDKGCMLYEFYFYRDTQLHVVGYITEQDNKYEILLYDHKNYDKKIKCLEYIIKILEEKNI